MTDPKKGGECADCRHCFDWECRRYPQQLVEPGNTGSDGSWPDEWSFPPSGLRCGEFSPREESQP